MDTAPHFVCRRLVEFAETDMAGIVHFANFYRYMEATEHAFFRALGMSVHCREPGGAEGAARRQANCEFLAPLRYEDQFEVALWVEKLGQRSITYRFRFTRQGDGEVVLVARGGLTAVFVTSAQAGKGMRAVSIPAGMRERLQAHLDSGATAG